MGLDQFVHARYATLPGQEVDGVGDEIAYWRKHNRLQGWMEDLYYAKGGVAESFNCVEVELTLEDLDALGEVINHRDFFGGDSYESYDEWRAEGDEKFLVAAREALSAGKRIFYSSWW